jgi:hypothetical protein
MITSRLPEGNTVNQPFYSFINCAQNNKYGISFRWNCVFLLQEITGKTCDFRCLNKCYEISKLYITIGQLITH